MTRFSSAFLLAALLGAASLGRADGLFKATASGSPKLQGIDVIAFGPGGALLIGDGRGGQLVAIDTKDTKAAPWKAAAIEKIDEKIAGRLGTAAKNIEITHLAVNRASGKAYLVVRKAGAKVPLLMTVDGTGKIDEFAMDKVDFVAVPLPKGEKAAVNRVTDLAFANGRILAGAVASEEFACKVYSVPTPLDPAGKADGFSTETYHVSHRKWETRAPMTALMPLELKGKPYVVGAFACTPLVRYPLEDVKSGAKVKGESVIELGSGNTPLNMFTYEKDGKSYVLMNTFRFHHKARPFGPSPYWAVRIDLDLFGEAEKLNEKATLRLTGKGEAATPAMKLVEAYHGAVHLDKLDDKRALVIKKDDKGVSTLSALDLP